MNGDTGKKPAVSAVYPVDPILASPAVCSTVASGNIIIHSNTNNKNNNNTEYLNMNGAMMASVDGEAAGGISTESTEFYSVDQTGNNMVNLVNTQVVGANTVTGVAGLGVAGENTTLTDSGIPLEQLKQLLSTQLDYYFSRFV